MSLTSTYVEADDGLFYKDPLLHSRTDPVTWFICFDDDDPPELVIDIKAHGDSIEAARHILCSLRMSHCIYKWEPRKSARLRPRPDGSFGNESFDAIAFFFKLRRPLPHSAIVRPQQGITRESSLKKHAAWIMFNNTGDHHGQTA